MKISATLQKQNVQNNKNMQNSNKLSFGALPVQLATKTMNALEFDGFNFSTLALGIICYGFVFAVRYFKARDKAERKDILRRDLPTITVMIFGRRAAQNVVSRMCTKITGLALHTKPANHNTMLKKVFNYLRPDNGVKTLSSSEITEKYSNIHQYKNGVVDFANFIEKQGGDVKKAMLTDKKLAEILQNAHKKWQSPQKTSFENASSSEIRKMLEELNQGKGSSKDNYISQIEDFFKDKNNSLVQKAKSLNSTFDFFTTFGFIPVVLGVVLPSLNGYMNKKAFQKVKE